MLLKFFEIFFIFVLLQIIFLYFKLFGYVEVKKYFFKIKKYYFNTFSNKKYFKK